MTNDVFGCWYEPGDAGTWFTWFINQHKDYPQFLKQTHYEQEGNTLGHIPTDYSCRDADWNIVNELFPKANTNQCYKTLPWHNPFQLEDNELENETVEQLAHRIIKDSNTKAIIIPQVEISYQLFAKRLAFIRPRFTVKTAMEIYENRINRMYKKTVKLVEQVTTVHTIAVDKLILRDDNVEYNKLLDILQVPALDNWKALTNECYTTIYSPWEHIQNSELDNRPETLKNINKDPYS